MNPKQPQNYDIETLNLNFTPKPLKEKRAKALATSSDRNHTPNQNNSWTPKNNRALLLEKKKNYSDAIRERNMNTMKSKKKSQIVIDFKDPSNDSRINTEQKQNNPHAHTTPIRTRIQSSLKKKVHFYGKRQSITVLDLEPIEKRNDDFQVCRNQAFISPHMNEDDCEFSGAIYDFGMKDKTLNMCSGIVNEKISNQEENLLDEKVKTLLVQNNTLKKELGNYRRQNSLLHRQLQENRKNFQVMQAKAKEVIEQNAKIENTKNKNEVEKSDQASIEEIMKNMQRQLNELRATKSNLELKGYMAEKRIVQEVDMWKKKMAKQVSTWRERCAKLRNENLRIKNSRDLTFSMDISQDD